MADGGLWRLNLSKNKASGVKFSKITRELKLGLGQMRSIIAGQTQMQVSLVGKQGNAKNQAQGKSNKRSQIGG